MRVNCYQPNTLFKMNKPIGIHKVPEEARLLAATLKYDYDRLSTVLHTAVRPRYNPKANSKPVPR